MFELTHQRIGVQARVSTLLHPFPSPIHGGLRQVWSLYVWDAWLSLGREQSTQHLHAVEVGCGWRPLQLGQTRWAQRRWLKAPGAPALASLLVPSLLCSAPLAPFSTQQPDLGIMEIPIPPPGLQQFNGLSFLLG